MKIDREQVRHWKKVLSPYYGPDNRRSALQVGYTAVLYLAGWTLMYFSLGVGYWLTLLLAVPIAGLQMRLFMFQHDCGHGSYFKSRRLACVTGSVIGVLNLTPYHYWRKTHAIHHAHSGDLDVRTFGDIVTVTVKEYEAMSFLQRFGYRFYRNPVVLFGPGALFQFLAGLTEARASHQVGHQPDVFLAGHYHLSVYRAQSPQLSAIQGILGLGKSNVNKRDDGLICARNPLNACVSRLFDGNSHVAGGEFPEIGHQ